MTKSPAVVKGAVLREPGAPVVADFPAPVATSPADVVVDVLAAPVTNLDHAIAAGTHALSPARYPTVVGREGIGRTPDGRLVYFDHTVGPHGSMAERALVPADRMLELPAGTEPALAAAIGNAGFAAWLPLSWRAGLQPGETVVILGAGGVVGSLAVQVAAHLGAGTVVAVVKGQAAAVRARSRGADVAVDTETTEDLGAHLRANVPGFDVIVDYLWGPFAVAALTNANPGVRLVQIGTVAGDQATISGALLRAKSADLLGFVNGRAPLDERRGAYCSLLTLAARDELRLPVARYRLRELAAAWTHCDQGEPARAVLMPHTGSV